jgi:cell fate (sporulation/competence/biofilm development) regulator YlbF (YheA/YmcA/DUF963 family)
LAEYMQVYQPDAQFVDAFQEAIVGEDSTADMRIAAFNTMRDGIVTQATRGAEMIVAEEVNKLRHEFGASSAYAQEAQAHAMWNDFSTTYPQLKDHKELVDMVSTNLLSSGYRPGTKDELYGKVSDGVSGLIQKFDQSFKLEGQQGQTQPAAMPEMASSSAVPQGGPGEPGPATRSDVTSIWD